MWALAVLLLSACKCTEGEQAWDLADGEACLSCHVGIEEAHPGVEGQCTVCHGGDGPSQALAQAHVPVPEDWAEIRGSLPQAPAGFIKDFPPDLLDQLDPAYLRFINPGDIRAAETSCGGCHAEKVRGVQNSIMTTNAGHYMPTRMYAGLQDREALYGAHPAIDPQWDGTIAGTVPSLDTLPPPDEAQLRAALAELEDFDNIGPLESAAYDHYLAKNCNTCHAAGYPKNNAKALSDVFEQFFTGGLKNFVYKGTNGRWRDTLTSEDIQEYENVMSENLTPDCAHWHATGEFVG